MDGMATDTLYQTWILQRARAPRLAGETAGGLVGSVENRSCGDAVRFSVRVADGRIVEARHVTEGCAICQASADLLASLVVGSEASAAGLKRGAFGALWEEVLDALRHGGASGRDHEGEAGMLVEIFAGVSDFRSRHRCATLPRQALDDAVSGGIEGREKVERSDD